MTKIAKLHDGRELQFPDDTPDETMHAEVRKHLTGEQARVEDVGLAGQRNKMLLSLVQQMVQANMLLAKLCKDQYATQELLNGIVQRVGSLEQTIAGAAQRIETAINAPVTQEVQRDADGFIAKTTIRKG